MFQTNPLGVEPFAYVKTFLLFQLICIAADHVSENPLYMYFIKIGSTKHEGEEMMKRWRRRELRCEWLFGQYNISEAPLFSRLSGHNLVTSQHGEKINSGIREIWTKLCVICRNILLYKLTVELFPAVSSCRISTSSISLNFACTCLQFRSEISVALGNERGLEPMTTLETRVRIEWDHHMFSTNQLFVSCLKTKLYEKPFTIWKFIAGTTLVTRLNP